MSGDTNVTEVRKIEANKLLLNILAMSAEHRQTAVMKIAVDITIGVIPSSLNIINNKKLTGYTVKYQLSNVGVQCEKALNPISLNSLHIIGLLAASGSVIHLKLNCEVKYNAAIVDSTHKVINKVLLLYIFFILNP